MWQRLCFHSSYELIIHYWYLVRAKPIPLTSPNNSNNGLFFYPKKERNGWRKWGFVLFRYSWSLDMFENSWEIKRVLKHHIWRHCQMYGRLETGSFYITPELCGICSAFVFYFLLFQSPRSKFSRYWCFHPQSEWFKGLRPLSSGRPTPNPAAAWEAWSILPASAWGKRMVVTHSEPKLQQLLL